MPSEPTTCSPPTGFDEPGWDTRIRAADPASRAEVLRWADAELNSALCCIIAPENEPSLRLAARHGFAKTRRTDYHGKETMVLERPAPGG